MQSALEKQRSAPRQVVGWVIRFALVGAVIALAAIPAPSESNEQRIQAENAKGSVIQSNSRSGSAIFRGRDFAPGDTTSGSVVISNEAKTTGHFVLAQGLIEDKRGYFQGRLSSQLHLKLYERRGSRQKLVYRGKLGSLRPTYLGVFKPRESRNYRFAVTFPTGGQPRSTTSDDNRFMGSAVRIEYDWTTYDRKPNLRKYVAPRRRGPALSIRSRGLQDLMRSKHLGLSVRCDVACKLSGRVVLQARRASASKKLARFTRRLRGGRSRKFEVDLGRKARRRIASSLRRTGRARVLLNLTATNAAGAKTIKHVRINLKRTRR